MKELFKTDLGLPPLHNSCGCDHRGPVFDYVAIDDGFAIATDAHQMVVADLYAFISEEEISMLNGYLIHKDDWKFMIEFLKKHNNIGEIKVIDNHYLKVTTAFRAITFRLETAENMKFPNWKNVWPTEIKMSSEFKGRIEFDTSLLSKIKKSFGDKNTVVHFALNDRNKAILVYPKELLGIAAILSPVMFSDIPEFSIKRN